MEKEEMLTELRIKGTEIQRKIPGKALGKYLENTWKRLSRESPSLGVLQKRVPVALGDMVQQHWVDIGLGNL